MAERIDLQEFVGGFVTEADELVAAAHAALASIGAGHAEGKPRPRAVRDLFRALHTIKGLAGMIGIEPIVDLAHALETLVRGADRAGVGLDPRATRSCIQGVDAIATRVRAVADGRVPAKVPESLLETIAHATPPGVVTPEPRTTTPGWEDRLSPGERAQLSNAYEARRSVWTVSFFPSEQLAASGLTIGSVRQRLAELGDIIKVVPRTLDGDAHRTAAGIAFDILIASESQPGALAAAAGTLLEHVRAEAGAEVSPPPRLEPDDPVEAPGLARSHVRVDLARLDALQEQLSLLLVSRFRLQREMTRLAESGADVRALRECLDVQSRQLRDLRRAILQARLIRASDVLDPLTLLVRSLARSSGKDVEIGIDAGTTELDKSVGDRLLPALVHLVRNAVDHAIESPEERTSAGKQPTGRVDVACHEITGNQIAVTISDDGRGIDREAIARRAERSIETDRELLDVITRPGFSTRSAATRTSGRGLGMDIVRRVIVGELGGELDLATTPGAGTTFTMRIPVTIAVLDVFSFVCGTQAFVVPVGTIEEIFELEPDALLSVGGSIALVQRRGRAIPVMSLGRVLAIDHGASARKALLIRRNGDVVAFAVDRLIGRQEVVIRPIDDPLVDVPGISGATDLGDGFPTLVLDLGQLTSVARERNV